MKIYIIIPAHNEASFLPALLDSLLEQTLAPKKIVLVDDSSTDQTFEIATSYRNKFKDFRVVKNNSEKTHQPGGKVVKAFLFGLTQLDEDYEVLMKLDADLVLPKNYLATIVTAFNQNSRIGMAGGVAAIEKNGSWQVENLTNTDHLRGALKAYRKACYQDIGGLRPAMGWDTVDEMLARFAGWEIYIDTSLQAKHLRPTGDAYTPKVAMLQGEAFYRMRYRPLLSMLASLKLASKKPKSVNLFLRYTFGYWQSFIDQKPFLISKEAGKFIRQYRWKKIKSKYF